MRLRTLALTLASDERAEADVVRFRVGLRLDGKVVALSFFAGNERVPTDERGFDMGIILFLVLGLVAGLIARAIMPGKQSMSIVMTLIVGVVGSFVGGFISSLFTHRSVFEFHTSGIIGSILGALAVLFIMGYVSRRRTGTYASSRI